MIFVAAFFFVYCLLMAVILFLWDRDKQAWAKERKELIRRLAEPQQVMVEHAPKREKPERVWTDEQYKNLMLSRGQIPRDN